MALPAVGRLGHFAFDEITRHRLSRGGDRAANNALHRIALVRMSAHPQTRGYVQRQNLNRPGESGDGLTGAVRCRSGPVQADGRSSKGPSDAEGDRHCGVGSLHS